MPTRPEYDGLLPEGDPTDLASLLRLNVERPNVRTPRPPVIAGGDPDLDALAAAMLGDAEPSPRALVNALRGRESLGEMGMAGGEWVRSAAAPVLQGARGRLGEEGAKRQVLLKRALWGQGKTAAEMPDEAMLAQAETIGIPRDTARMLTKAQLQGLFGSQTQRRIAADEKAKVAQTPEAIAAAEEKRAREEEDRAREEEESRIRREKGRVEIEKGRRDLAISPASPRFGEEWEPLPSSPLIDNEQKRIAFLDAAGEAKEARRLAAQLKSMVAAGLGPTSSGADKTRAESIVTRLQLIGKKVDALGVLSETDITKFIEPQLVNPADITVAAKKALGQFDPTAQIDQYLANLDGKIEASAKTWAVRRKGKAAVPPAASAGSAASTLTPRERAAAALEAARNARR